MLLEQLGALIKILTHDNAPHSCIDIYKFLINKVLTLNHVLFIDIVENWRKREEHNNDNNEFKDQAFL